MGVTDGGLHPVYKSKGRYKDMTKFAIWKDHKVIGYIDLTEEQRQKLNETSGINVYFGFDRVTKPEMYEDETRRS